MSDLPPCSRHLVSHTHWDREWYLPFTPSASCSCGPCDGVLDALEPRRRVPALLPRRADGRARGLPRGAPRGRGADPASRGGGSAGDRPVVRPARRVPDPARGHGAEPRVRPSRRRGPRRRCRWSAISRTPSGTRRSCRRSSRVPASTRSSTCAATATRPRPSASSGTWRAPDGSRGPGDPASGRVLQRLLRSGTRRCGTPTRPREVDTARAVEQVRGRLRAARRSSPTSTWGSS